MKKQKTGSPAQGAEPIPVSKYREFILEDLKTARVMCHFVSKDISVRHAVVNALVERVPTVNDEAIQRQSESAYQFLTLAIESAIILDQLAEITQGLGDNLKQKKDASTLVSTPGSPSN